MKKNDKIILENFYDELVEEGKSGHGDVKAVRNMLFDAQKRGLVDYREIGDGGWLVKSKVDKSAETIHKGERALHYLRRFLQRLELDKLKRYG
jgi:hypothetical protein